MFHTVSDLARYFLLGFVGVVAACSSSSGNDDVTAGGATKGSDSSETKSDAGGTGAETTTKGGREPGAPLPTDMPERGDFVFPMKIWSGFDGVNVYKVPVTTMLEGVTWTSSDPSVVTIEKATKPAEELIPTTDWAIITTKKPGTATITATSGSHKATADVVVTSYTVEQHNVGKTRYTTATGDGLAANKCTSCHGSGGVDHSPTRIGAYDDAAIVSAITTAAYPDGRKLTLPAHKWSLTDAEKPGIVAFLRSLPPWGF